jgi:high-affinity iron transporter
VAILLACWFVLSGAVAAQAEPQASAVQDQLMPLIGGALVEAGQSHWGQAAEEIGQFEQLWTKEAGNSQTAAEVTEAVKNAKRALQKADSQPDQAKQALTELAKATDAYLISLSGESGKAANGQETVKALMPLLKTSIEAVKQDRWDEAIRQYDRFVGAWPKAESAVRSDNFRAYGDMEAGMSLARIALKAETPVKIKVLDEMGKLYELMWEYTDGSLQATYAEQEDNSIADLLQILVEAQSDIRASNAASALERMQLYIRLWPSIEGEVSTRSPGAYVKLENWMMDAPIMLSGASPDLKKAGETVNKMIDTLMTFVADSHYTAWDAGLILLREGLEAFLVLAALLALLRRTGNDGKRGWVWAGAGTGLAGSVAIALVLTFALSQVSSGGTQELLEGITGLATVVLMLTVGARLHGKANVKTWNRYLDTKFGLALAGGSLWSLFIVAALAVLREGAETSIFYMGMASSIAPLELVAGTGCALLVLLALGFAVIRFSAKIPVRPFFLCAAILIYYLVIKFLGESLHALQVAGKLSAHSSEYLPEASWLGIYPTWESLIPQLAVLLVILLRAVRLRKPNVIVLDR